MLVCTVLISFVVQLGFYHSHPHWVWFMKGGDIGVLKSRSWCNSEQLVPILWCQPFYDYILQYSISCVQGDLVATVHVLINHDGWQLGQNSNTKAVILF